MMPVLVLLLAGLGVRLLYLVTPRLDSDQAIFGLMAMHILRGELPIFQWGYHYMGTFESFVAAPLMLLFGPTRLALNLSPVLFSLLFAGAAYLFAREAAGRTIGLWALAFACFPPIYLIWTVIVARGAYSETLALGTLAGYLAMRATNAETPREEQNALVGVGLALGLSFWTHLNTVIYGAAILLFWAIERPRLIGKAALWAGGAFLLGSAPFWYGTIEHHFDTFLVTAPPPRQFGFRLNRLLAYRLPIILGITFDGTLSPTIPIAAWLLLPIHLGGIATLAWLARASAPPRPRRAARLLLMVATVLFVVYLVSNFSSADTQRYLVPLYTLLVIAPALLVRQLGRAGPAVGLCLLALQAVPAIREAPALDRQALHEYREERAGDQRLIHELRMRALDVVYSDDYWDGARLTFDARERVIFANPFADRSSDYLDRADGAEHAAFLFHSPDHAAAFEGMLRLASARYTKTMLEGYTLFYPIEATPSGGAEIPIVSATASDNEIDTRLAFDDDAATRWTTLRPQRPGMWISLDLGAVHDVAEVTFWPRFAPDAPQGLRVESSDDGVAWKTATEAKAYWGPCSWARGRPLPSNDGWVVARFASTRARFVRLTQLGEDPFYSWSISEIRVRGPGNLGSPGPLGLAAAPGRLLADPVTAARLAGAVRHWQGEVIPLFEHLRDVSFVEPTDRLIVGREDALASGKDSRIGAVAAQATPADEDVVLSGVRLDTDPLQRRVPTMWTPRPIKESGTIDVGGEVSIAGVVVEHGDAVMSFPRGLAARTSIDGTSWSDPETLEPRPSQLFWSDEGLVGASFHHRIFRFASPRHARFVELTASPRHPRFPWLVTSVTVLVAP